MPNDEPEKHVHEEGEHPHPIAEEHERVFSENDLVGDVLGAINISDSDGLRELSATYKLDHPEALVMYQGIDIIADCAGMLGGIVLSKEPPVSTLQHISTLLPPKPLIHSDCYSDSLEKARRLSA